MSIFKTTILYFSFFVFIGCVQNNTPFYKNNLNKISLYFEGDIAKKSYTPAVITIDALGIFEGKIKRRGGHSMRYPKHSFEFDLKNNVPIDNLPADDDWILNANYIDKTFLRHALSYQLFREMSNENIASHTRYLELYLNDDYHGLYVLMQKLDASALNISTSDPESFIFKEPPVFIKDLSNIKPQKEGNFYQQIFPKINIADYSSKLVHIRNVIGKSDDNTFSTFIQNTFNLNNILDWHLLLLLSNNNDGIVKNFYLYKRSQSHLIEIAPWDYDHSFGRDGDNELNLDQRQMIITKSSLFERLLKQEWYKDMLKARWHLHNKNNLLTTKSLHDKIDNQFDSISKLVDRNFKKWPAESNWYYDHNSAQQEIEIMHQFITLRHQRLTDYFAQL